MKYSIVLPALATAVLAQSQSDGPNCGIITQPPLDDTYPAQSKPIAIALVAINDTTVALNQSLDAFDGSVTAIVNLQDASSSVLANINAGNANVSAIPALTDSDEDQIATFDLVTYVGGLACTVNATIDNLIDHRQALIDACVGPIVLQSVEQQQSASTQFEATVRAKLSPSLQDTSDTFVEPINVALSSGVSAFADQTTLPASCTPSSSTTTTGTATASASLTSSTGGSGIVSPTGANGNGYGYGNGWQAISASSSAQPTGAAYSWSAYSVATGGATGGSGASYTWSAVYSATGGSGSHPTGSYTYNNGGDDEYDDECEDDEPVVGGGSTWAAVTVPTGGSTYGSNGGSSGPKPTYPASQGWQAVSSSKPYGSSNSTWAPYTGAATSNMASGMGVAAIAVMAVAAML